jgi:hypothetical protein
VEVRWKWALPSGWEARPAQGIAHIEAEETTQTPFTLSIPAAHVFAHPKQAIALDVSLDGRPLGQIAEAVVEHQRYGGAGAPDQPAR